jgi:hypothetical protein
VEAHPIKSVLLASLTGAALGLFGLPKRKKRTAAKDVPRALVALILEAAADSVRRA